MKARVKSARFVRLATRFIACAIFLSQVQAGCLTGPVDNPETPAVLEALYIHTGGKRPQRRRYHWVPSVSHWFPVEDYEGGPGMGAGGKWIEVGHRILLPRTKSDPLKPVKTVSTILMAGGVGESGYAGSQAYIYNYADDSMTHLTMGVPRGGHTMTQLADGRGLIVGGYDAEGKFQSSAEIFDPETNTFTATGSMAIGRVGHSASLLPDGRVLIIGGSRAPAGTIAADGTGPRCEFFDPAKGQFSTASDSIADRYNHSAVTLDDSRVLLLGTNGLKSAEVFDPATNQFAAVGDMSSVHGYGQSATALVSGKVLVLGGWDENNQATAAAELFDPATSSFTSIGNMTSARRLHFAVLMSDGRVIIGGGYDDDGDVLKSAEVFDPTTNTFTPLPDMPIAVEEPVAACVQK